MKWCGLDCHDSESTADVTVMTDLWISQDSLWKDPPQEERIAEHAFFFFFFHESVTITSDNIPTNWGHTSFSYEIALLFITCVKAEITYFFRVLLDVDDSGRRHDHWFIVDAAEGIFFVRDTLTARVFFFFFFETTSSSSGDKHLHAEVVGLVAGSNPFHNSPTWELYRSPDDYLQ